MNVIIPMMAVVPAPQRTSGVILSHTFSRRASTLLVPG
jgi:hypothetical protein